MPRTAVLIPSLNSPLIDVVLDAVLAQDGADLLDEVLIVGRDEPGLVRSTPKVHLLDTRQPASEPTARNLGLAATDAELIVFLDSDCVPQPGWLEQHLRAHAAGHELVAGSVLPDGEDYWSLVYNLSLFHGFLDHTPAGPRQSLPTLNLSCARSVAERIGPFDESLSRATDLDWTFRARAAGIAMYFWPAACVQHRHARHTLSAVWRDCAGSGRHSRHVRLRHAQLLGTPRLLRRPWLIRAATPALALWVTLRTLWRWPSTFRTRWRALPGFFVTKLAWGWGASSQPAQASPSSRPIR